MTGREQLDGVHVAVECKIGGVRPRGVVVSWEEVEAAHQMRKDVL